MSKVGCLDSQTAALTADWMVAYSAGERALMLDAQAADQMDVHWVASMESAKDVRRAAWMAEM